MVAVIDIGSNSIRMSLYERQGQDIKRLLHQKRMTGLIGYVEDGVMPKEGLEVVCSVLADFEKILNNLHVEKAAVFSTASLRNIENTEEAVRYIEKQTGSEQEAVEELYQIAKYEYESTLRYLERERQRKERMQNGQK